MNMATETAMVRVLLPGDGGALSLETAEEGAGSRSSLADQLALVHLSEDL